MRSLLRVIWHYPVNDFDLTGTIGWKKWFQSRVTNVVHARNRIAKWADKHPYQANIVVTAVSLGRARGGAQKGPGLAGMPRSILIETQAKKLGYTKKIPANKVSFDSKKQPVFQKGQKFITPDVTSHKGGSWKLFIKKGGNYEREGTYDATLKNRIGK